MLKHFILTISIAAITCASLAACAAETPSQAQTPVSGPTSVSSPTDAPSFTITGTIRDISASARVIHLDQTLEGFNTIALTDKTEILSESTQPLEFTDLKPGLTVQAEGPAGESSTIVAERIQVLRPAPSAKAAPLAVEWGQTDIPEAGLTVATPNGWPRRGIEWAWTNPTTPDQLVGVNWNDRAAGWEPTSMLPNHAVNLDRKELPEINWGRAAAHTVEVYDSAANGGKITSAQMHVLVLTETRAFDFYASAASMASLQALIPLVLQMASDATVAKPADAAGQVAAAFITAVQKRDLEGAMALWTTNQPDQPKDYAKTARQLISTWIAEQPHWAIAGPTTYTGPVAPKDYQPLPETDPRVEKALVNIRLGNLDGAFSLVKVDGQWRIWGWAQP